MISPILRSGTKMKNRDRTKQPLSELEILRNRVLELQVTEQKHAFVERELEKRTLELEQRVRELNCLYEISRLFEEKDILLEEIIKRTVDIIAASLQNPANVCTRIFLENRLFAAGTPPVSAKKLDCDLVVHGNRLGVLEVYCREGTPDTKEKHLIEAVAGLLERIIEQKQTEIALLESERRFRSLVESSPTGIFIIQNNQVVYENPEESRISGPLARLFREGDLSNIHPDDAEKVKLGFQRIITGEERTLDMDFRFFFKVREDADPEMKWVHCRASMIEYLGKEAILVNKLDVTRAKELEYLLRTEDKMAALGRVAAGIAHEIRNPLSGINIYLSNLERMLNGAENMAKVNDILDQLQAASNKIESVIRRVLDFSRPSEPRFIETNINHSIKEALGLSSVTLRKTGIAIDTLLAPDLPLCDADPSLITQVILNLMTNAAEAMKNMDARKIIEIVSSVEKGHIAVTICDSGSGVPFHLRKKIFDPFFTTKDGNTGIGLSLSHRIVSDHGGSLTVSDSRWGGAAFTIRIPVRETENTG
jgi:PAS domain S-box-containing protein